MKTTKTLAILLTILTPVGYFTTANAQVSSIEYVWATNPQTPYIENTVIEGSFTVDSNWQSDLENYIQGALYKDSPDYIEGSIYQERPVRWQDSFDNDAYFNNIITGSKGVDLATHNGLYDILLKENAKARSLQIGSYTEPNSSVKLTLRKDPAVSDAPVLTLYNGLRVGVGIQNDNEHIKSPPEFYELSTVGTFIQEGVVLSADASSPGSSNNLIGVNGGNGTWILNSGSATGASLQIGIDCKAKELPDIAPVAPTGLVTVNGGTMAFTGSVLLGRGEVGKAATATLEMKGGRFTAEIVYVGFGEYTNSTVLLNGGTLEAKHVVMTTPDPVGATSTLRFNGGTLKSKQSTGLFLARLTNAFVDSGGATIDINGQNSTIPQVLESGNITNGYGGLTLVSTSTPKNGVLTLSGINTYRGNTIIKNGILSLGNALALQNSALDTEGSADGDTTTGLRLPTGDNLTLGGLTGNKTLASVFTSNGGRYASLKALTLNVGTGQSHNYSGIIANGASGMTLTKDGEGTQILSGSNTYTGNTIIKNGFLSLGNSLALRNSALDTTGSARGSSTIGLGIEDKVNNLTLGGLTGNKDLASVFTTNGRYGNLKALTLNPGTGQTHTYSGIIADGAPGMTLTKTGAGTQILGVSNTYTGNTHVYEGTLTLEGTPTLTTPVLSRYASVTIGTGAVLNLNYSGTAVINSLTLGGQSTAAGTWGGVNSTASNKTDRITGMGTLTVSPLPQSYLDWAATKNIPTVRRSFADDADGDGLGNLLEWVLNGDPVNPASTPAPQFNTTDSGFSFTFYRSAESLGYVSLAVEWSLDLSTWSTITIPESGTTHPIPGVNATVAFQNASADKITVTFPMSTQRLFVRLKATAVQPSP